MGNQRVFYACQGICYNDVPVEGVQSVTLNTQQENIVLDQYGSLTVHKSVPNYPEITVSITRAMSSGIGMLYSGTLEDNINTHNNTMCLFIGKDTESKLASSPASDTYNIFLSGVSINSVTYNFPADGNFTEELELITYHKYFNKCPVANTVFSNLQDSASGLYRRQSLNSDDSIIATNLLPADARISNVSVNASFGIQDVKEFGMNISNPNKLYRYASLPIVTSTSVTAIVRDSGLDFFEINPADDPASHLCHFSGLNSGTVPLKFKLCGGHELNLGTGNLTSLSYNGGSVDGGNVEVNLTFESANVFTFKKS